MVSRITAFIIQAQGENIICDAWFYIKKGQWVGTIELYEGGKFHSSLLESDACYGSKEEAIASMQAQVQQIRETQIL